MAPDVLNETLARAIDRAEDEVLLPSIRAELCFHLLRRWTAPKQYAIRNLAYPLKLLSALFIAALRRPSRCKPVRADLAAAVQYGAAGGYGTVEPVLTAAARERRSVLMLVNDAVYAECWGKMRELSRGGCELSVINVDASVLPKVLRSLSSCWREAATAYAALVAAIEEPWLRRETARSRLAIWAQLLRSAGYRRVLAYVLRSRRLRVLITHNDFTAFTWQALRVGEQHGAKVFTLQHGAPSFEYFPISSPRYVVWGQRAVEQFCSNGADLSVLLPLGCPRMDSLYAASNISRNDARRAIAAVSPKQCSSKQRWLLFVSHTHSAAPSIDFHEVTLRYLRQLLLCLPDDVQLLIKLHPQEDMALYNRVFDSSEMSQLIFLGRDTSNVHLIRASDLVMSPFSTMLLESMLLQVPTVQVNFPRVDNAPDYSRSGGAIYAQEVGDVLGVLDLVRDPVRLQQVIARQRSFCEEYFANFGHATGAVLEEVLGVPACG